MDPWITDDLYLHPCFKGYFDMRSGMATNGLISDRNDSSDYVGFKNETD